MSQSDVQKPSLKPQTASNADVDDDDGVGVVRGYTVVGEEGVQEGTKYTPLRGLSVEDQCGRRVVAYPYQ